ncbi:hypothetical protein CIB84_013506 [Bambusicola thoracicus]|uniref:Uncharacterized protein n=1 Tax=Bambusicola thoracicus TaxID=9083 RepID=A0A2P4SF53_BAMTH|nr:hypothetical protein CIB84_013506 [Bambusicola thoracicus]
MIQLQALLNESLIRTKHVENAAAIGINEREVCASTSGFYVPPENAVNLIYAFYKNLLRVRKEGLYFRQKHYECVRADEHSIYLKNVCWQLWQCCLEVWRPPTSFFDCVVALG